MIKVSVITPVYNRENWVENMIKNLPSQILEEIEFIIVDDGSSDKTYEEIIKRTKEDKRFVVIKSQENKGPYHARNIGLEKSQGEYIGFFDSDDNIPQDYFKSLYEQAKKQNADIIYTTFNNIPHELPRIKKEEDKLKVIKNGAIWDKLFKKEYLIKNQIKFTEGLYTADNLFILQAFLQTNNIILTSAPSYEYRLQSDSISKDIKKQEKRKQDILQVLQKAMELSQKYIHSQSMKKEFLFFLQRSLGAYKKDKNFQKQFYKTLGINEYIAKAKLKIFKIFKKLHKYFIFL